MCRNDSMKHSAFTSRCTWPNRRRCSGLALVAVLWAIMLLSVVVSVIAITVRLDGRVAVSNGEQVRGEWACRAGIEKAIALLNDDSKASDCLSDYWSNSDIDCNDIVLDGAVLSIKIIDEVGKLNINTATREQLLQLPEMTEDIADSIIDWRDEDNEPKTEGAEQPYYSNMAIGYRVRNGPFRTVRELLLVKGVSRELLYGEDTNLNGRLDFNECDGDESPPADNGDDVLDTGWLAQLTCYSYDRNKDAQGQDRVNINKADEKKLTDSLKIKKSHAKWIVENQQKDGKGDSYKSIGDLIDKDSKKEADDSDGDEAEKLDLQTFKRIADKITVTDDEQIPGRINVNTASRSVLLALLDDNEKLAGNIISRRNGLVSGMESIGELLDVEALSVQDFKKIAANVTTRSGVFSVMCFASTDRTDSLHQAEAVVDRNQTPGQVLYLHQGANN